MKPDYINFSICVSSIPKDKIKVDKKTGKKWLNMTASLMKQPDKFGNTYTAYISQDKDELKEDRVYIGKGKEFCYTPIHPTSEMVQQMPPIDVGADDLPF